MSIHCYVGMPGSGKSYNAVENQILPALRAGRTVVTNIPLRFDALRALVGTGKIVEFPLNSVMQNPETIKDYVTKGCLFVLDEAWRIWPSGQKTNDIPEVYKSLLAEHRHMVDDQKRSTQIVLIVQDASNIATFARKLVESTFIHTKLSHVGAAGRFRVDIYHGPVTGTIGPKDRRDREIFGTYKSEIWDLYQSHTMSDSNSDGALEAPIDKRHNALRRPMFVILIPLMLGFAGFAIWHLMNEGKKYERPKGQAATAQHGETHAQMAVGQTALGSQIYHPVKNALATYRVLGYVRNVEHPEKSLAVLANGKDRIFRGMDHCRTVDTDFMECEIAGTYYGQTGGSVGGDEAGAVPVSAPLIQKKNYPIGYAPPGAVAVGDEAQAGSLYASNTPAHHSGAAFPAPSLSTPNGRR